MTVIDSKETRIIDEYAQKTLKVDTKTLMGRVGAFVADEIKKQLSGKGSVLFLAGSGNNGGDAYAAACALIGMKKNAAVIDVFEKGQTSEEGKHFLAEYERLAEKAVYTPKDLPILLKTASVIVDAVFGCGFHGTLPDTVQSLFEACNALPLKRFSIDLPSGVDGTTGAVSSGTFCADVTLSLCLPKRGIFLAPAREYCGEIRHSDIGLDTEHLISHFGYREEAVDEATVKKMLPSRKQNSSKGDFGKALLLCGSDAYPGAAMLACEAASRTGAGYTVLLAPKCVTSAALLRLPSLVCDATEDKDRKEKLSTWKKRSPAVLLIGCGCGVSERLRDDVYALLETEGCPLILDADALNSLALLREESTARLAAARRDVLLTPHPLEFSRLSGIPVDEVQRDRYSALIKYQEKCKVNITLKGFCTTTVTKREQLYINTSGTSALAKAGSGDVLAGAIAGLVATGMSLSDAAVCGVYLHGKAGESLASRFSSFGILPHELPKAIAAELSSLEGR